MVWLSVEGHQWDGDNNKDFSSSSEDEVAVDRKNKMLGAESFKTTKNVREKMWHNSHRNSNVLFRWHIF